MTTLGRVSNTRRDDGRLSNGRRAAGIALIMLAIGSQGSAAQQETPLQQTMPPGRLVDVGGYRLHIHCIGQGSPTVIIDGGAGAWSIFFAHIQSAVSGARVCTYDRAGLGWSERGPSPRTSARMVEELHNLLHGAGVAPPLIMVGHSLGGYNVRLYQSRYPEEVGALVLVDAAHEAQWDRLPPQARQGVIASVAALKRRAEQARKGELGQQDVAPAGVFRTRVPEFREAYVTAMLDHETLEAIAGETEASFESARQVPSGQRLGDLPLIVLTARNSFEAFRGSGIPIPEASAVWLELQKDLAGLSTASRHVYSEGHHRLHESDPDAIAAAIQLAIETVRARPAPPAGLGVPREALPPTSTPAVDRLLEDLERAYGSMDIEGFLSHFADDVIQLDVNRRVHVKGKPAWRELTRQINAAHRTMERRHRGRAVIGNWVVAEIEWAGTIRGEAFGTPGRDLAYRYTGLGLFLIDGKIKQQLLYGDYATLSEQLGALISPEATARSCGDCPGTNQGPIMTTPP